MDEIKIGSVVLNPKQPAWGPGKVLYLQGGNAKIFFRDDEDKEIRNLKLDKLPLALAPEQRDEALDSLPPFNGTTFDVKETWVSFESAVARFQKFFPLGFNDETYLGVGDVKADTGERNYKVKAHEQYVEVLGAGQAESMLERGKIEELASRV